MIKQYATKSMLAAGAFMLLAAALFFPVDAFAGAGADLKTQASFLSQQVLNVPKLIALGSYIIGTVFAVRALFALKGFIESPDDNPITKVLGFGAVAALLIMLPYIITLMGNTIGARNDTLQSSSSSFTDSGF